MSGNNSGYRVHVSSVLLCWRHVCLKSSFKNWPCLQLTCFVRLSHKINPWLVTKEKWSKQLYLVQYRWSSYDSFHCNMILLRKQISEQLLLGLNWDYKNCNHKTKTYLGLHELLEYLSGSGSSCKYRVLGNFKFFLFRFIFHLFCWQ